MEYYGGNEEKTEINTFISSYMTLQADFQSFKQVNIKEIKRDKIIIIIIDISKYWLTKSTFLKYSKKQ